MKNYTLFIIGSLLMAACAGQQSASVDAAKSQIEAFAEAYFNYDFRQAEKYVTPESGKWLRFAASNVTQEDLDMINAQELAATAVVSDCLQTDDSTFQATVEVCNFLQKDSLEMPGTIVDQALFKVMAVEREGNYLVRMACLPRSERQNPD